MMSGRYCGKESECLRTRQNQSIKLSLVLLVKKFVPMIVHVPSKPAFVRCPMLGSLLHPQWEAGFCNSTELQYQVCCGCNESVHSSTSINGYDVCWNNVWLAEEERQIVRHRVKSGHWVHEGCVPDDVS